MKQWHKITIGLLLIVGMIVGLKSFHHEAPVTKAMRTAKIAPATQTPRVDAVVLENVTEDTAKKINDAIPFAKANVPAAAPFRLQGSPIDTARALDCLASALFYEAGNEAIEGQKAVAQVILNRVRHPAYPKTVCGVVYQGQERRTGCQFSFSCDGSMARTPSPILWQRLRGVAQSMLSGEVYAPVGWATHYHTDWVVPVWSAKLDKIRAEATHLFFRWTGFWGTPAAFRGRYVGNEPTVPKLVRLSAIHGDSLAAALDVANLAPLSPPPEAANRVAVDGSNGEFIVQVDRGVRADFLPILAARTCGNRDYCKLFAWTNSGKLPSAFPVGEAQLATAAFSFLRNRAQNFEKSLWNCTQFPEIDRKQCIKRRMVIEGKVEELIPVEPDIAEVVTKPAPPDPEIANDASAQQSTGRRRPGS